MGITEIPHYQDLLRRDIGPVPLWKRIEDLIDVQETIAHHLVHVRLHPISPRTTGLVVLDGLPHMFEASKVWRKRISFLMPDFASKVTSGSQEEPKLLLPSVTLEEYLEKVDKLDLLAAGDRDKALTEEDEYRILLSRASEYKTSWTVYVPSPPLRRLDTLHDAEMHYILFHLGVDQKDWVHLLGDELKNFCRGKLQEKRIEYESYAKKYGNSLYTSGVYCAAVSMLCDRQEQLEREREKVEEGQNT